MGGFVEKDDSLDHVFINVEKKTLQLLCKIVETRISRLRLVVSVPNASRTGRDG